MQFAFIFGMRINWKSYKQLECKGFWELAEGRGFEPPVGLRLRLISSQVPLTTQPPFQRLIIKHLRLKRTFLIRPPDTEI